MKNLKIFISSLIILTSTFTITAYKNIESERIVAMRSSTKEVSKPESDVVENDTANEEIGKAQTTNPASTYCVEQGGELVLINDEVKGSHGICKFKDGTEIEEWEFYRQNHDDKIKNDSIKEKTVPIDEKNSK